MADGVVLVAADGRILFANPAAELLFGRAATDLEATRFGFPVVAGDTAAIDIVRAGGESIAAELRVVETEWEGEPAHLVSLRDVTDRKRAEERAAQLGRERVARAEAEAGSQAKSEFLAMMSHELRTPLNAVIGYADLLDIEGAGQLSDAQRHHVARIRASGRHLLTLVNEILDLTKIEAGRLQLDIRTANASTTADAALALVQPLAERRGIALSPKCACDGEIAYQGDEDRVRQILVNLLTNAVKFTEPGGSVSLDCGVVEQADAEARLPGGPWMYLRVTDTGIGIPSSQIAAIFDPFVQVRRGHTRPTDGSGLGLTISRRLARLMSGRLTVRSEVGRGSVFTLWVPVANAATQTVSTVVPRLRPETHRAARMRGLSEAGEALARGMARLVGSFVSRLREEPTMFGAQSLRFSQLADHIGSFVADLAIVLIAAEEQSGEPSSVVADGTDIQRLIAERHGAQRAHLGWSESALRREWKILVEEIEFSLRRRLHDSQDAAVADALAVIRRLVDQSAELSCRAWSRAPRDCEPAPPVGV